MSRMIGSLALLATVTALLALAPAASAKGCRVGDERSYGTTYVLSISVSDTSCRLRPQGHQGLPRLPARQVGQMRQPRAGLLLLGEPLQQGPDVIRLARQVQQGRQDREAHVHAVPLTQFVSGGLMVAFAGLLWRCASALAGPAPPNDSNQGWDAACCRLCDAAVTWFRGHCPGLTVPGTVKSGQLAGQGRVSPADGLVLQQRDNGHESIAGSRRPPVLVAVAQWLNRRSRDAPPQARHRPPTPRPWR